jgi:hypothetical protein
MVHGSHIVRDFLDVFQWNAWCFLALEKQEIGKRGLRALNLRRKHGLLSVVEINEKRRIWQD